MLCYGSRVSPLPKLRKDDFIKMKNAIKVYQRLLESGEHFV